MVALTGASLNGRRTNRLAPIIANLRNPIIVSLVLGAIFNFLAIPIFAPLLEAIALAGRAALPCALFILGTSLATISTASLAEDRNAMVLMCLLKLIIIPGLVLFAARQILQLEPMTVSVLVILAACPSGINVLPFAQHSARETRVISAGIFVSTIMSILTLPAWLYVLTLY